MPGGDGTGPGGMGPMTGRAAGYCAGYSVPGFMNPVGGRGYRGRGGRGGGRGWRNWYHATGMPGWARAAQGLPAYGRPAYGPQPYATPYGAAYGAPYAAPYATGPSREQELEALKGQADYLEDALDGIRQRIEELQTEE